MDPIRFKRDLRVTIQALGWRSGGRYLPLQDDIAFGRLLVSGRAPRPVPRTGPGATAWS